MALPFAGLSLGPYSCSQRGTGSVNFVRVMAISLFITTIAIVGCSGTKNSLPLTSPEDLSSTARSSASTRGVFSLRSRVASPDQAWCEGTALGTGEVLGGPITIWCVLDPGQSALATIQVPVDEADSGPRWHYLSVPQLGPDEPDVELLRRPSRHLLGYGLLYDFPDRCLYGLLPVPGCPGPSLNTRDAAGIYMELERANHDRHTEPASESRANLATGCASH